jgi:hypothetical protein
MIRTRTLLRAALLAAAALAAGLAPGPAHAVVGGHAVAPEAVPWFAVVGGGCGGSLVAPDRVLTAAHCVAHSSPATLGLIRVAGVTRPVARIAFHPNWRRQNGPGNFLDDVALVQFDEPVAGARPVTLGGTPPAAARILGRGRIAAPGSGLSEADAHDGTLREAVLRPISDTRCARDFARARGNSGERFDARRMLCAIDANGRPPLSSGCNGDSGGPLYTGEPASPVLLGVVSWGGAGCGADHLPSVFADVGRYRAFITDPAPVWAPVSVSPARISGPRRVRGILRCTATATRTEPGSGPTSLSVRWLRQGRYATFVGDRRAYRVTRADRGRRIGCLAEVSTAGGSTAAPSGPASVVRIPAG